MSVKKMGKIVFITGSSGFIGSNLAKRILNTERIPRLLVWTT